MFASFCAEIPPAPSMLFDSQLHLASGASGAPGDASQVLAYNDINVSNYMSINEFIAVPCKKKIFLLNLISTVMQNT